MGSGRLRAALHPFDFAFGSLRVNGLRRAALRYFPLARDRRVDDAEHDEP